MASLRMSMVSKNNDINSCNDVAISFLSFSFSILVFTAVSFGVKRDEPIPPGIAVPRVQRFFFAFLEYLSIS